MKSGREDLLFRIEAWNCDIFSAEVRWAALVVVGQYPTSTAHLVIQELTICRAGLFSSSSSLSQQERMWRSQSPIFSPKLLLAIVVGLSKRVASQAQNRAAVKYLNRLGSQTYWCQKDLYKSKTATPASQDRRPLNE